MPKIPSLTPKQVITLLEQYGFQLDHTTGSHYVFYHPQTKKRVTVAYHSKDIPKGTLFSILKQAGITRKELK
jgi:predicted RNA binding protein YcfA (HicA-like mRNA interferase family)